jgi:translation elongation factor EF-4
LSTLSAARSRQAGLLEKQNEDNKRMPRIGTVAVPQQASPAVLELDQGS